MSAKFRSPGKPYIEATVSSTNEVGDSISMGGYTSIGFQCVWTGTLAGTISVEVSNDGTNWTDSGVSAGADPAGSAGNSIVALASLPFSLVRLKLTYTSGSGDFTVRYTATEA